MKLEDQCCSLELAKRLKELGVPQNSYSYWIEGEATYDTGRTENIIILSIQYQIGIDTQYSAYTSAELGEILPDAIHSNTASGCDRPLLMNKVNGSYSVGILNPNNSIIPIFFDNNEANARAKMLIYLLENGLVKVEDLK